MSDCKKGKQGRRRPEATVVTHLQITHILRGCTADEAAGVAEVIAETAMEALARGYADGRVTKQGQPDDVCVEDVQVFSFDGTTEAEE